MASPEYIDKNIWDLIYIPTSDEEDNDSEESEEDEGEESEEEDDEEEKKEKKNIDKVWKED